VSGYLEDLLTAKKNTNNSRTLSYLREENRIEIPEKRRIAKGVLRVAGGKIFNIKSKNIHEVDLYTEALLKCSSHLNLKIDDTTKAIVTEFHNNTNSIGILLGGGRGTKTNFLEKRWPHTFELIKLILDGTNKNLMLFGSEEDLNHDLELKKYINQNS
jgi:hypothetical protein